MLILNIYVNKKVFFAGKKIVIFSNMLNKKMMSPENKILDKPFL